MKVSSGGYNDDDAVVRMVGRKGICCSEERGAVKELTVNN